MSTTVPAAGAPPVEYPDSDGEPMAENTLQFRWIVTIKEGLAALFSDRSDVFVAGDLLWYPVEGDPTTRVAPDALVAFGRPAGDRGSYKQWEEGGTPPHVVFEVLSPGNRAGEMERKLQFYDRFSVEEYYIYDPDDNTLEGWRRDRGRLREITEMNGWTSPRLGVRFELDDETLHLIRPDGAPFQSVPELYRDRDEQLRRAEAEFRRAEAERERAEAERERAEVERGRTEAERQRAEEAERRAAALAEKLRALGIDPESA